MMLTTRYDLIKALDSNLPERLYLKNVGVRSYFGSVYNYYKNIDPREVYQEKNYSGDLLIKSIKNHSIIPEYNPYHASFPNIIGQIKSRDKEFLTDIHDYVLYHFHRLIDGLESVSLVSYAIDKDIGKVITIKWKKISKGYFE